MTTTAPTTSRFETEPGLRNVTFSAEAITHLGGSQSIYVEIARSGRLLSIEEATSLRNWLNANLPQG